VQRFVSAEAIDESAGGGNTEHGLGDEGARQAASILGRPAGSLRASAAIITKDEDFAQRNVLTQKGPVVIWIRLPNTRRRELLA